MLGGLYQLNLRKGGLSGAVVLEQGDVGLGRGAACLLCQLHTLRLSTFGVAQAAAQRGPTCCRAACRWACSCTLLSSAF